MSEPETAHDPDHHGGVGAMTTITTDQQALPAPLKGAPEQPHTRYIVIHHSNGGLVIGQETREWIVSTGNVLGIIEWYMYSIQPETIKRWRDAATPVVVLSWGCEDRYGVLDELGWEVIPVQSVSEIHSFCEGHRPYDDTWVDEDGHVHRTTLWVGSPERAAAWPRLRAANLAEDQP